MAQLLMPGSVVAMTDQAADRLLKLDSGDAALYRKLGSPDICIHLAWRDGFRHNSPAHMKDLSSHVTFLNTLIDGGLKDLSVMGTMHEAVSYTHLTLPTKA